MNMDIVERLGRVCEDGADPDLIDAVVNEIIELRRRLDAMRQCFIDNTLRTTPSAKGTNIGKRMKKHD